MVHHPGEDAGVAAAHCQRVDPRAFERLPRDLQQQPLLRVHRERLARRDAEEGGVELGGVVQEAALAGVRPAGSVRLRVVKVVVPVAVRRKT